MRGQIYRIYTEKKNKKAIAQLVAEHFRHFRTSRFLDTRSWSAPRSTLGSSA